MGDNPHFSDTLNTNRLENQDDKSLIEETLLTVAYVKNECTSNAFDYNNLNSKGYEDIHGQHVFDIHDIKTENIEAFSDNTSSKIMTEEHDTMLVEEESHHTNEHGVHHVKDISQHERIGEIATVNIRGICPSSFTQSRTETHKYIHKRVHSGEKRFDCDLCDCTSKTSTALKTLKPIEAGVKPFTFDICNYSLTTS